MKINMFVILTICMMLSCHNGTLIDKNRVIKLVVVNKEKQILIENKDSICTIIDKINSAVKDPAVFLSEYEIMVYYKDTCETILCNSNRIKVDGVTYKLKKSFKTYLE